jgi:hypothetical protein
MKNTNLFRDILRNYFIIFTVILLVTALLNQSHSFTFREIILVALFALAGDLPTLVYYSKKELSPRSRFIRDVIHFLLLETVIVTFGNILGQVSGVRQSIILALEVLLFYLLVILITWLIDHKTAKDINKQLANMRAERKE